MLQYGLKRLAKVEQAIQDRLKREAKRYNKTYPGELAHFDTKRLPLLKGQFAHEPGKYLLVAIDGLSRELHAGIFSDKTQYSAAHFLMETVIAQCPYQIPITARNLKEQPVTLSARGGTAYHGYSHYPKCS